MAIRRRRSSKFHKRKRTTADNLLTLGFLAVLAVAASLMAAWNRESRAGHALVADGDSISIAGEKIRLEGIDAPEVTQICKNNGQDYNCGDAARDHLRKLVEGRQIECQGWERDRYDRFLGWCRAGDTDLNGQMVSDGWAVSYGAYQTEEAEARATRRGIWQGEFDRPSDWRIRHNSPQRDDVFGHGGAFKPLLWGIFAFFDGLFG